MFTGEMRIWKMVLVFILTAALVGGCIGRAPSAERAGGASAGATGKSGVASQPSGAESEIDAATGEQPTVSYKLMTMLAGGKMVFLGASDGIRDQVNPDLVAAVGDLVEIILVNGNGLQAHNLVVGGYKKGSPTISKKGEETRLLIQADQEGTFPYSCSHYGHVQAGMKGKLIVASTAAAGQAPGPEVQAAAQPLGQADQDSATRSFQLVTSLADGKMAFVGVGGELEGKANPDLEVNLGDTVEILLGNGDNIQHNVKLPDFGLTSEDVVKSGDTARLVFKANQAGSFPYYCDIPGHRQAGMEGKLIVVDPSGGEAVTEASAPSISLAPDALPAPLTRSNPDHVRVDLETVEVEGRLADGSSYTFWTFNGTVPGPFIRVRVGDTVEVHLKNALDSAMMHSVDFHAVTGPGGGAVMTQAAPGEEKSFTFKALNPGLYVYHCATPMVAHHIANGMYGLILVEPEGGLAPVDQEFYVMQGEIYTAETLNTQGALTFSVEKLLNETPEYFVFNGAVGALAAEHPLQAKVGETVRIFFGVGGPNFTSSFHVIGEIFDRVYDQASLTAAPLTDVQTTLVPPGGATMVEFTLDVPGRYILVDHALSRLERGLAGYLIVEGPDAPEIFNSEEAPAAGGH